MMIKVASSGFRRVSRWLMAGSNDMDRVVEEEKDRERLKSREKRDEDELPSKGQRWLAAVGLMLL